MEYRDSHLPPAELSVATRIEGDEWIVSVVATTLVRDLTLQADRIAPEAAADRALETILPGETVDIRVLGAGGMDPALFADAIVLRCANDLVAGRSTQFAVCDVVAATGPRFDG